jgi:hypothetical protein
MTKEASSRSHSAAHSLQGSSKASLGHQLEGAEAAGVSEEDMGISSRKSIAYSMVKTRATLQEHARLPFRNKKRLPKQKPGRISRSRFYILLRVISLHTRICGQSTCSFCCFGKPFTSFLAPACTATTIATCSYPKPAARRASAPPTATRLQGGVRSSYSQQHCTRIEAHILRNILLLKYFYLLCHFIFCTRNK